MIYPWHYELLEKTRVMLGQDNLPPALAVCSPRGWFAQDLLSEMVKKIISLDSSQAANELAHPDVFWVKPEKNVIKIDQIREIGDFVYKTSQKSVKKVVAIEDAYLMNANSSNALLKVLEDSPNNTHLLLDTINLSSLIPTIRSRCQSLTVKTNKGYLADWLQEEHGVSLDDDRLAEIRSPQGYLVLSGFDLDKWVTELSSIGDPSKLIDDLIQSDTVTIIEAWARRILLQQTDNPNVADLEFVELLNRFRVELVHSNSTNIKLGIERLVGLWSQRLARRDKAKEWKSKGVS